MNRPATRLGPIRRPGQIQPAETESIDGWAVPRRFTAEPPEAPAWVVELIHIRKGLVQASGLGGRLGLRPGQIIGRSGWLVGLINPEEAYLIQVDPATKDDGIEELLTDPGFTDLSEGLCLLAVFGPSAGEVLHHLSPVDLARPAQAWTQPGEPFCLAAGLVSLPVLIFNPNRRPPAEPGLFLALERSSGQAFYDILSHVAGPALVPAGLDRYREWLRSGPAA